MRRITLFSLAFFALTSFASCGESGAHKPLMAGVEAVKRVVNDDKATSVEERSDNTGNANSIEGIEIPAPLEDQDEQVLTRKGYTVSYNKTTMQPNWVAWHLTEDRINGPAKRPQRAFHEDEEVPEPRAVDNDYYSSGYDRGHMCPAADNKLDDDMMYQSFLFTNICPQNHNLNVGDWNEMENQCRRWAKRYDGVYIVCGPIFYNKKHKTIGKHKIPVPEAFFKVVLRMGDTPQAIGFIYKNESGDRPKGDYVNTVDQVERITGYDFFPALPDDVEKAVEAAADLEEWSD